MVTAEDIKSSAAALGFTLCGIAPAQRFPEHLALADWISQGFHADMRWMETGLAKRLDPQQVLPQARSVIVCAINYNTAHPYSTDIDDSQRGWIARYAWGDDYHDVLTKKLDALIAYIQTRAPENIFRRYVDTGPVMERVFAKHAGIGWIGKNTCVINTRIGSWLLLATIITDLELPTDHPATDHCGNCTRCIDACPTQALIEPHVLDARKCISYLTIEHRGDLPEDLAPKMGNHLFGCDICQDVCPWNRKAPANSEPAFQPREGFMDPDLEEFERRIIEEYPAGFSHSPLKRAKLEGLLRNVRNARKNAR